MKLSVLRSGSFIIVLLIITALTSCNKEVPASGRINDFKSLTAQFKEPSKEFTTAPFFVWNYKITRGEIDHYMNEFKKQGSSQVFIHPRPGLVTEYLSDEWFDLFKYTVEKGKQLEMNVWIYDENSYPSGFGGGHVPDQMPESYNQGQGLEMKKFESLPDTANRYFLCLKEDNGKYTDITASVKNEMGKPGKYLLFHKTYNGKSDWYGGFSYVDLLYPGVTEKFIEITMKGYEKSVGTDFGQTVPGTFTDEPQITSPGGIRWTPDLFDAFQKKWNYDLRTQLPSLFEETGDWKKVRHDYTQTLLQLFIDRWAKPWNRYCEEKGLKFTGHYWEHEWPNMQPGGDNMAMYAWHQVPAIDMLFNQWNDVSSKAQFGNVRSVKELASAANQTGRQRKLSETYGGAGWELSFTDMKRLGDWEYALGVNLMNQHLAHITLAGARKYDYPLTFTYHEPWWNDYKYINDHYARLSLSLSSGYQKNDILILEPTTTAWLYDSYVQDNPKVNEIGQSFQSFITKLEKAQVEYDMGSENIIKDRGSVKNNRFIVGECSYSTLVIPPMMENLDLPTFSLIKSFVANGGKLVAFSHPSLVNGETDSGLAGFLDKNSDKITFVQELTAENIPQYFSSADAKFNLFAGKDLYHHRRILADGQLLFLANSSLTDHSTGSAELKGTDVIEMNTVTGQLSGYQIGAGGEKVTFSWDIPPAGSLLLFIPSGKSESLPAPGVPMSCAAVPLQGELRITKDSVNAVPLEFCDVMVGGVVTKDLNTYDAADKVFKFHGFRNGNPWNTSVQFRTGIVDRDTFRTGTGFTATYHFNVKGAFDRSGMRVVVERPELWAVSVNGTTVTPDPGKWWLDRSFGVFGIGSLVRTGDNVISLNVSPMKIHAEIEPVYVIGDFSAVPEEKGWSIAAPAAGLVTGSWKGQGMPFYSWGVNYTREFTIDNPDGKYIVSVPNWKGTLAEVKVNGTAADPVAFPPYESDVTDLINPGVNTVEVKVFGSLKNLLGPHFNNPAPGLVSPWHWRYVKSFPPGKDYQLLDYGMMDEFYLLNRKY
jgi:hypothetical protein